MEEVFGCRSFSWYGHNERTVLAGECEHSHQLHIFPEYGVTELIDSDGEPITSEGQTGEIVGTGFLNWSMPFIRYKTGDLARYTTTRCSCGRNYTLLQQVEGRESDYLVARDGHLMPAYLVFRTLITWNELDFVEHVLRVQFFQEAAGEVNVRVVPAPDYTALEVQDYVSNLVKDTLPDFKATVNIVPEINLEQSGKFRHVVQKLPLDRKNRKFKNARILGVST